MSPPMILPLTGIPTGLLPADVIVCGDPKRALNIAHHFDSYQELSHRREYLTLAGEYKGMPLAVCSHGIGAPGAAIAFEEIAAAGGRRIIRCGSCGSLEPEIKSGHLVIPTGAVASTGYVKAMVPEGFPAVADAELVLALKQEAHKANRDASIGIVVTIDAFYAGVDPEGAPDYPKLSKANVVATEMECAALFLVGTLRRLKTAAILAVDGNVLESRGESMDSYQPHRDSVRDAIDAEIDIALNALVNLNQRTPV